MCLFDPLSALFCSYTGMKFSGFVVSLIAPGVRVPTPVYHLTAEAAAVSEGFAHFFFLPVIE